MAKTRRGAKSHFDAASAVVWTPDGSVAGRKPPAAAIPRAGTAYSMRPYCNGAANRFFWYAK